MHIKKSYIEYYDNCTIIDFQKINVLLRPKKISLYQEERENN